MKLIKRIPKRWKRAAAFLLGAGIAFMGAGAIYGYAAIESAIFGATGAALGLIMSLSFTYAGKGEIANQDYDAAINDAINAVSSKTKKQ